MLFCDQFDNYEDFKSRFGYKTGLDGRYLVNANGVKQRKNNVLYLFWKEESIYLHKVCGHSLKEAYELAHKYDSSKELFKDMLYGIFRTEVSNICPVKSFDTYELLNSGICVDGDVNSIRYRNTKNGNIYKMKIGKYVGKYLEYLKSKRKAPFWVNNPTLHIFFIEELTELWKNKRLKDQSMRVVIDKDFHKIYNPDKRSADANNFASCMDGHENWKFYKKHEDIYDAISLQDDEGLVYARAILVHCFDDNDNPHTYIERIYCNKRMYKDLLFEKAKYQKIFDLYKGLEASCHDNYEIYSVDNDQRIEYRLYIPLELESIDYMSYQDTFKWYYPSEKKAYNTEKWTRKHFIGLATTELKIRVSND